MGQCHNILYIYIVYYNVIILDTSLFYQYTHLYVIYYLFYFGYKLAELIKFEV
jgi:hypothetical protein